MPDPNTSQPLTVGDVETLREMIREERHAAKMGIIDDELGDMSAGHRLRAAALARAVAVLERLPVTADGVVAIDDDTVWLQGINDSEPRSYTVDGNEASSATLWRDGKYGKEAFSYVMPVGDGYSTESSARIAALEAELAAEKARKKVAPPISISGDEEFPFAVEWHDGDDVCFLRIEGGHVDFTHMKGGKVHKSKKWIDPSVSALEAENLEQARLLGMGSEREAALRGKVARLEVEVGELRGQRLRMVQKFCWLGGGASASLDETQIEKGLDQPHADHQRLADWIMTQTQEYLELEDRLPGEDDK